jgi:hypothetical protein
MLNLQGRESARTLAAAGRFGRYKQELELQMREEDVKTDPCMERLAEALRRYASMKDSNVKSWQTRYEAALNIARDLAYTAQDVEKFCVTLIQFHDDFLRSYRFEAKVGFFLSALVNHGSEQKYRLLTRHLPVKIRYLCTMNEKEVELEGDAGRYFGKGMKAGVVTMNGNCQAGYTRKNAGFTLEETAYGIEGGVIEITGNWSGGLPVSNAKIVVHGNAGRIISRKSEIIVGGNASFIFCEGGSVEVGGRARKLDARNGAVVSVKGDVGKIASRGKPKIYVGGKVIETIMIGSEGVFGGEIDIAGDFDINDFCLDRKTPLEKIRVFEKGILHYEL